VSDIPDSILEWGNIGHIDLAFFIYMSEYVINTHKTRHPHTVVHDLVSVYILWIPSNLYRLSETGEYRKYCESKSTEQRDYKHN